MRYRSAKQEAKYKDRRVLVRSMLRERPLCEACPIMAVHERKTTYNRRPSRDIHELVRRSQGGSILDPKNLLAVCGPCHRWITEHPADGEKLGLCLPSWTTDEMYAEAAMVRQKVAQGRLVTPSWLQA